MKKLAKYVGTCNKCNNDTFNNVTFNDVTFKYLPNVQEYIETHHVQPEEAGYERKLDQVRWNKNIEYTVGLVKA